jgi:glycosyltransferase involved in cell wall biosynthesis
MPRSKWLLHVGLERFFGLMTSLVICVSREDYALARRLRFVPFGKVVHVPNGVALDRFDPERLTALKSEIREKNGLPVDATVITIMGRLVREKGYFEFFHAARQLAPQYPGVHFMVIGDTVTGEHDGAKVAILELAGAEELKGRVHFMGLRSDIPELLAACDVFVLPSYREGMPVSILEAMAMGLPVVATRIRGCREEVIPGRTGLLVEPENAEELAEALGFLLRNPEPRRRMGRAGRLIAERHFDERRTLQRQVRLYRLLERRLRP